MSMHENLGQYLSMLLISVSDKFYTPLCSLDLSGFIELDLICLI